MKLEEAMQKALIEQNENLENRIIELERGDVIQFINPENDQISTGTIYDIDDDRVKVKHKDLEIYINEEDIKQVMIEEDGEEFFINYHAGEKLEEKINTDNIEINKKILKALKTKVGNEVPFEKELSELDIKVLGDKEDSMQGYITLEGPKGKQLVISKDRAGKSALFDTWNTLSSYADMNKVDLLGYLQADKATAFPSFAKSSDRPFEKSPNEDSREYKKLKKDAEYGEKMSSDYADEANRKRKQANYDDKLSKEYFDDAKDSFKKANQIYSNRMNKKNEANEIESYISDIIEEMSIATDYADLYFAAENINNTKLRKEVIEFINICENDNDSVEEAYSIVTSDLLDSRRNELNTETKLEESKNDIKGDVGFKEDLEVSYKEILNSNIPKEKIEAELIDSFLENENYKGFYKAADIIKAVKNFLKDNLNENKLHKNNESKEEVNENVTVVNEEDSDGYYENMYLISFPVSNFSLDFKVYADNEEQALEILVAYAEDNAPAILTSLYDVDNEEVENGSLIPIDATPSGAKDLYYIDANVIIKQIISENKQTINKLDKKHTYKIKYNDGAVMREGGPDKIEVIEGKPENVMKFLDDNFVDNTVDLDTEELMTLDNWIETYMDDVDPTGSTIVYWIEKDGKKIFESDFEEDEEDWDEDDDDWDEDEDDDDDEELEEGLKKKLKEKTTNINDMTPEQQVILLTTQGGELIKHIKNPTREVQFAAVNKEPHNIEHIKNPDQDVQMHVIEQNPFLISFIKDPNFTIQLKAVVINPDAINYIDNPHNMVIKYLNTEKKTEGKELNKNINSDSIAQFVNFLNSPSNETKAAINNLNSELKKLKKSADDEVLNKLEDFTNFRRDKYNHEMEALFKQLGYNFLEIEYSEEDKGTIQDYIAYINNNK